MTIDIFDNSMTINVYIIDHSIVGNPLLKINVCVSIIKGDSGGGDAAASPHKMSNSYGTKSKQQGSATSNEDPSDDGESITLDQFLQECNKSPKSRVSDACYIQ